MANIVRWLPALTFGGGVAVGYLVAGSMASRPQISLSQNPVPAGGTYTMTLTGFPANTQIVALQALPSTVVNLGVTNGSGTLVVANATAQGPAGNFYIVAWDAPTGKYSAVYTLIVS